jgi:Tfp pilus assembly protein PilF
VRRSLAALSPEVSIAHANLADAARKQGKAAEALAEYRQAAARRPEDMRLRVKLGLTLAALGRDDEAMAEFSKATQHHDQWEAHYNLGLICSRRGQTQQAMAHFRQALPDGDENSLRALEKTPDAADVLTNLAMGMLDASSRPRALRMLRRATELAPRHVPSRINLGNLCLMEGKVDEARAQFETALAVDPSHPMAHNNLGYVLMRQGKDAEARPHLELAFNRGEPAVRESARKALMRLGAASIAPTH